MTERRLVLTDLTHMDSGLHEAGRVYALSRAVTYAAAKRGLVAAQRSARWAPPGMFRRPVALTEAEAGLPELQRHELKLVDPKTET